MEKQEHNIGGNILEIIPLGAGREVGRSCVVIKYKGKTIMFDCGIHPADTDISGLPYFDLINPAEIDMLLITHFHLDHLGAAPYFLEKTEFSGKTYMTYPTKAIYKHVLVDSLRIGGGGEDVTLFDRNDINNSQEKITPINFHEEIKYKGVKFTCYNAGHVLGAAMFLVDIAGVKILYTGDYSIEQDRHIQPAEIPPSRVDIMIVESTYGVRTHPPRAEREKTFVSTVHKIINRQGHCLLPVFVLGRAQELLLIQDQYWSNTPELQDVQIFYASTLMTKCMQVFQTYINMTGQYIKNAFKHGDNPFNFKHVEVLRNIDNDALNEPSVVMASPGMLQKGLSRALFEKWCHDPRNGVIFTGYCVEGTFADDVMKRQTKMKSIDGENELNIKMDVENVSFCAHADFEQTRDFINQLKPKHVVQVHGEKHEAEKLKKELDKIFPDIFVSLPKNGDVISIDWKEKMSCKVYGLLGDHMKEKIAAHKLSQIEKRKQYDEYIRHKEALEQLEKEKQIELENAQNESTQQENDQGEKDILKELETPEAKKSMNEEQIFEKKDSLKTKDIEEDNENGCGENKFHMTEEELENYIAVNISGVLLKKNFNYVLLDEPDVKEFVGKDSISIDQIVHISYMGTLALAHCLVKEIYAEAEFVNYTPKDSVHKRVDAIKLQKDILIHKDDIKEEQVFEWKSSKKNDIICDCQAYMMSQIPKIKDFDIFHKSYTENQERQKEKYDLVVSLMKDAMPDFQMEQVNDCQVMKKDNVQVEIDFKNNYQVTCSNEIYKERIKKILESY